LIHISSPIEFCHIYCREYYDIPGKLPDIDGSPFTCPLWPLGKKRDVSPNEVMHPINDLTTNWYGEHFGYHPNLEMGMGFNAGFNSFDLSPMEDPLRKHTLVNEVKDIAHRKGATDLIVNKLDRLSLFVQFFTIIVAVSLNNDN